MNAATIASIAMKGLKDALPAMPFTLLVLVGDGVDVLEDVSGPL